LALGAIDTLSLPYDWSFGGGTALAIQLDHRTSYDIDIFFPDSRALRELSPQRNPAVRALSDIWQEPGHHLTIERPEGEIDFLSVALRTAPGVRPWRFHDREIPLETPCEIMAKKLCFRGNRLLARDLFDIAAIRHMAPSDFDAAVLAEPTAARRVADTLQRRSERLVAELPQAVRPTTSGERLLDIDVPALVLALNR
jgi:hypothetical protein